MKRGIYLFSLVYLVSLCIGLTVANASTGDPLPKKSTQDVTDPQPKSDSTDTPEQVQPYDIEAEMSSLNIEDTSEPLNTEADVPASPNTYYDNDDETEESSSSIVSFNFLYYLLQKFMFSNSLGY